ncbi:MAG: M20/M25/M40 family metallo-hydrolase [Planctomycetes bacterium]|nr:M20/M25/M40 family metallo-hydrolase [Planctomycetota bacterium]
MIGSYVNLWRRIIVVATVFLAAAPLIAAEAVAVRSAAKTITADELKKHVGVLADDAFEGREAGSRGGRAAGVYLGKAFRRLGLRGAGDNGGYYQPFDASSRNILAIVEGSDEKLKKQVIVVGAHYDHVGYGNSGNSRGPTGYIHNGADDNASGSAALLEVAEALSRLKGAHKRSVLFVLWDGEEQGLLGSQHWIENPTVPLARVAMMINLDMVGRLRKGRLQVFGTRSGYGLRKLVSQQNDGLGLTLEFPWEVKHNSDHHTFYRAGIPILMMHTGLHSDYHRPTDDVEKVNFEGIEQVSRFVFRTLVHLADAPALPKFRSRSRRESNYTRREKFRPGKPPRSRFGVVWSQKEVDGGDLAKDGLHLTRVVAQSAADKAGLQAGDRIVEFAGKPLVDTDQFRAQIWAAAGPVSVVIRREGEKEPLKKQVELAGKPVRLGISWKMDDAEPGVAVLVRVMSGTPAGQAGLKAGDRIHKFAGVEFSDSDELLKLAKTKPSPIEVVYERAGQVSTVSVKLVGP